VCDKRMRGDEKDGGEGGSTNQRRSRLQTGRGLGASRVKIERFREEGLGLSSKILRGEKRKSRGRGTTLQGLNKHPANSSTMGEFLELLYQYVSP